MKLLRRLVAPQVPTLQERKDQKELQDLSVRILDHLGHTAGLCLEQTAWLRPRTVVVKNQESDGDRHAVHRDPAAPDEDATAPVTKDPNADPLTPVMTVPSDARNKEVRDFHYGYVVMVNYASPPILS